MSGENDTRGGRGGCVTAVAGMLAAVTLPLGVCAVAALDLPVGEVVSDRAGSAIFGFAPAAVLLGFAAVITALVALVRRRGDRLSLLVLAASVIALLPAVLAAFMAFATLMMIF